MALPNGWTSAPAPGYLRSRRLVHRACNWHSSLAYDLNDPYFIEPTIRNHICSR